MKSTVPLKSTAEEYRVVRVSVTCGRCLPGECVCAPSVVSHGDGNVLVVWSCVTFVSLAVGSLCCQFFTLPFSRRLFKFRSHSGVSCFVRVLVPNTCAPKRVV